MLRARFEPAVPPRGLCDGHNQTFENLSIHFTWAFYWPICERDCFERDAQLYEISDRWLSATTFVRCRRIFHQFWEKGPIYIFVRFWNGALPIRCVGAVWSDSRRDFINFIREKYPVWTDLTTTFSWLQKLKCPTKTDLITVKTKYRATTAWWPYVSLTLTLVTPGHVILSIVTKSFTDCESTVQVSVSLLPTDRSAPTRRGRWSSSDAALGPATRQLDLDPSCTVGGRTRAWNVSVTWRGVSCWNLLKNRNTDFAVFCTD
jgi:hypothetical protein